MDLNDVRRLGERGFEALPPQALADAGLWLNDFSTDTGDSRYRTLSDLLFDIEDMINPRGKTGGLPARVTAAFDALLRSGLPAVLDAADASAGETLARRLYADVVQAATTP